jgi:UDP-glucose 4-epimerase
VKTLVIGRGGLIGSSLETALFRRFGHVQAQQKIFWDDPNRAVVALSSIVQRFFSENTNESWAIAWCAGQGSFASKTDDLKNENLYLEAVLEGISKIAIPNGVFFYTSSAGAIYTIPRENVFDENSLPSVANDYGHHKLAQENLVFQFAQSTKIRSINGRVVSVYGPNQNLQKPQGLISRLCLDSLRHESTDVFVPLGTTRNYLFVTDATEMIARYIEFVHQQDDGDTYNCTTKIFCGAASCSISSICRSVSTVSKRKTLIRSRIDQKSFQYPEHFKIRSVVHPDLSQFCSTTLISGISAVYQGIQGQLQIGKC